MISDSKKEMRFKNLRFVSSAIIHQKNIETGVFSIQGNLAFLRRVHKQSRGYDLVTIVGRTGSGHLRATGCESLDTAVSCFFEAMPDDAETAAFFWIIGVIRGVNRPQQCGKAYKPFKCALVFQHSPGEFLSKKSSYLRNAPCFGHAAGLCNAHRYCLTNFVTARLAAA
ncbi:hypothetical protein [uncultured Roseibium sp.]|uniref:hypothetical protein n=1 Tax=uncultured Roseibium sp. TaxID=1936171 RepID=UPI00261CE158|nr:hypothetical protein [uncultured Roseibium sp.]